MADKTVTFSLDELEQLEELLMKSEAIANMVGYADTALTKDSSLGHSMWAVTDFIGEAKKIISKAINSNMPAQVG